MGSAGKSAGPGANAEGGMKIEAVVTDDMVDKVVEALAGAANTGKIGDGKIFVVDVEMALRIRTGEKDAAAIAG